MEDRVVLITGASSGLGAEMSKKLVISYSRNLNYFFKVFPLMKFNETCTKSLNQSTKTNDIANH